MSDQPAYPSYPTGPDGDQPPAPARPARPRPVDLAVKLIWTSIALTVLSVVVALTQVDEAARVAVEQDATGELTEATARAGILALTVVLFVVGVGLYALLAVFVGRGRNWARIVFTVLGVLFSLLGAFGLLAEQTAVELIVAVLQILLTVAAIVLLFRPESGAFFRAR